MKRYLYLIIYIGLGLSLAACKQQPKKFVIGVSQCSEDIWRNKLNDELKMGEYLNDSIIVKLASSNDDNVLQNKQVNQFVDEGVDLLVISPNQLSAISKAVERAYEKGIPVILYDRISNTDKYTAFIGCDNYHIGKSMGTFIAQKLQGKGRIVEICGLDGSSPAMERHLGFMDAIKPYPGIQVIASEEGNWKEEGGVLAMKRILKKRSRLAPVQRNRLETVRASSGLLLATISDTTTTADFDAVLFTCGSAALAQLDIAGLGGQQLGPGAVAFGDAVFAAFVALRPDHPGGFELEEFLQHSTDRLADHVDAIAGAECVEQFGQGRLGQGHR